MSLPACALLPDTNVLYLTLGIEHYSFESKGSLGTCSWVDFPEDAGGKTAADFHSNLPSKTSGLVRPFNFLGRRKARAEGPVRKGWAKRTEELYLSFKHLQS